jgi:hypothetical protein
MIDCREENIVHGSQPQARKAIAQRGRIESRRENPPSGIGAFAGPGFAELRKLVREWRDRAQTIAARQRRELRGKAAPKGARAATDDSGTREKGDLLAAALQRLNKEVARREAKDARQALIDNAKRALELRRAAEANATRPSPGRTTNEGINPKDAPAYSLRNPAKLGAVSQHTKNMQAKRD